MAKVTKFHVRVGLDDGSARQFGGAFDPPVEEQDVDAFAELFRNTVVNILEDAEVKDASTEEAVDEG